MRLDEFAVCMICANYKVQYKKNFFFTKRRLNKTKN